MNPKLLKTDLASRHHFAALDGFRGLLAVFVAIYHTIWISHPQEWRFLGNGPVIIDLFFAFSGFLMWRLYADKLATRQDIGKFLKRRFARLYPLHLFMLLIFVAYAVARLLAHKIGLAHQGVGEILPFEPGALEGWAAVVQHLFFLNAVGLSESLTFNPPSWTVGAEFLAYLVFVAMMFLRKPTKLIDFAAILIGVLTIYGFLSTIKPNMNITHDYGFLRCLAGFYLGVLAAVSLKFIYPKIQALSALKGNVLEWVILLGSIAFVVYAGGKGQFFVAPVIFLFVVIFACDKGAVSKFMSGGIFMYLAKISYSVYLVHTIVSLGFAIVLERVLGHLPTDWIADFWLAVYLVVVIGLSHLTYKFVEVPGGRLIRNWKHPQKQVAEFNPSV